MSFRVLHPGTFSLLVDFGRPRSRSLGIPLGGAADRAAFSVGNALVGNCPNALALEMTLSGPTLVAEQSISACVFGAPFAIFVNGRAIGPGSIFQVNPGETLQIGRVLHGARGYLCVRGGFRSKTILGSNSALQPIGKEEVLHCDGSTGAGRSVAHADATSLLEESSFDNTLRIIDGPQSDWFADRRFFEQSYTVSRSSNRMGIRLEGEPLPRDGREMVSEAVAPGAIQITNEGLPIILGVDGQTIGGYPKIAHVIRADLDRLAQLRAGHTLRFVRVDIQIAEAIAAQRQKKLQHWQKLLRLASQ